MKWVGTTNLNPPSFLIPDPCPLEDHEPTSASIRYTYTEFGKSKPRRTGERDEDEEWMVLGGGICTGGVGSLVLRAGAKGRGQA